MVKNRNPAHATGFYTLFLSSDPQMFFLYTINIYVRETFIKLYEMVNSPENAFKDS